MELLIKQCEHNQTEEPCEVCNPQKEEENNTDIYEYDYYKRLWF